MMMEQQRNIDWDALPDGGRRETFLRALRTLHDVIARGRKVCIVETGTARGTSAESRSGDGWSTVTWGWYCSQAGGRVYSIDIDPKAIETSRELTREYADYLEYVQSDSLACTIIEMRYSCRGLQPRYTPPSFAFGDGYGIGHEIRTERPRNDQQVD
jgi:hypothetical protein